MIQDIDESLRAVVRRDVLDGANVEISFEAPTRDWAVRRNAPTLNLYLYEIREDLQRREVQFEERRDANGVVIERRLPARKFKLSYLITAWTQRPEDEHRLLSAVLSCFIAFDALPTEVLQGDLAEQGEPIRTTIALPRPPDRPVSDVWTALGGELKPSLDLIVTAPVETGRGRHVGPLVREEPRITFRGSEGEVEEPREGDRRNRKQAAAGSESPGSESPGSDAVTRAALSSEVVHAGKEGTGRTFGMRALLRE
ncbi:MAG TPA: DUF4255 domain-containing protein [Actinomycetota bacterium]|nr:DUF4255 domain-containing protein [Actinomycetota bacterium]